MMVAVAYERCSTTKQDLESQEAINNEWARKTGKEIKTHYKDFAISGMKNDREGINKLLQDAEQNKFDIVVVPEISRLGRSIGFIHSTIEKLNKLGIKVVLANSNTTLDYNTLEGRALIGGLALAADIEWMLISERNKRGRDKIKRLGIKTGRKLKEEKGLSIEAVKALREKGLSMRLIGKELNSSPATIMRILHNLESEHKTNIQQSNQNTNESIVKTGSVS
jgi:DNA invertase Pin-like site-specific DNA recombinase